MTYMKRWCELTPKPRQEDLLFYTSLLYQKAIETSGKTDKQYLEMAKREAEKALNSDPSPKQQFYMLLVAIAQQEGKSVPAANYLEQLVSAHPTKIFFEQLVKTYLNLAAESDKSPKLHREYLDRALDTRQRAQALGIQLD